MTTEKPWAESMPEEQFQFMRKILAAPSPVGFEGAMTYGVLRPFFEEISREGWGVHQFTGNAGLVLDTHPGRDDMLTVMLSSDLIKMSPVLRQVQSHNLRYISVC